MSKSVLVMDTPENCDSCCLRREPIRNCPCCAAKLKRIKDPGIKPDWCPLKPLPEKNTAENDMTDYQCGMVDGWNACLREIVETSDENERQEVK